MCVRQCNVNVTWIRQKNVVRVVKSFFVTCFFFFWERGEGPLFLFQPFSFSTLHSPLFSFHTTLSFLAQIRARPKREQIDASSDNNAFDAIDINHPENDKLS